MLAPGPQTENGKNKPNLIIELVPSPSGSRTLPLDMEPALLGLDAPDPHLTTFQKFILLVEWGNLMKKKQLNMWRQERCQLDSMAIVSDDEADDPLPNIEDFADIVMSLS